MFRTIWRRTLVKDKGNKVDKIAKIYFTVTVDVSQVLWHRSRSFIEKEIYQESCISDAECAIIVQITRIMAA